MADLPEFERAMLGDAAAIFDEANAALTGIPDARRFALARRAAYFAAKKTPPEPADFSKAEVIHVSAIEGAGAFKLKLGLRVPGRPVVHLEKDAPQSLAEFAGVLERVAGWLRAMGRA